jgi:deazaflavin-dependent oxidoreductase (nitroreductase family)
MDIQFLYLTTTGWKTGKPHRIEIWFVEHDRRYYITSERGRLAHWIQNIMRLPKVSFNVYNMQFEGSARILEQARDHELSALVSKLMREKYGWSDGLIVELISDSLLPK